MSYVVKVAQPEMTGRKQAGRFQQGKSGNPAGRPIGARHRTTVAIEALLNGEGEAVARAVVKAAIEGDMVAARLVLERICPPRKGRTIRIDLPHDFKTTADLAAAQGEVISAMARGEITPEEAADTAKVLEHAGLALERQELEARIAELESSKAD